MPNIPLPWYRIRFRYCPLAENDSAAGVKNIREQWEVERAQNNEGNKKIMDRISFNCKKACFHSRAKRVKAVDFKLLCNHVCSSTWMTCFLLLKVTFKRQLVVFGERRLINMRFARGFNDPTLHPTQFYQNSFIPWHTKHIHLGSGTEVASLASKALLKDMHIDTAFTKQAFQLEAVVLMCGCLLGEALQCSKHSPTCRLDLYSTLWFFTAISWASRRTWNKQANIYSETSSA